MWFWKGAAKLLTTRWCCERSTYTLEWTTRVWAWRTRHGLVPGRSWSSFSTHSLIIHAIGYCSYYWSHSFVNALRGYRPQLISATWLIPLRSSWIVRVRSHLFSSLRVIPRDYLMLVCDGIGFKSQGFSLLADSKLAVFSNEQGSKLPSLCQGFLNHSRSLRYGDVPDYGRFKNAFRLLAESEMGGLNRWCSAHCIASY